MSNKTSVFLLNCPFCGGEAEVNLFLGNYCITCKECSGAIFPCAGMTKEEAIEAWNARKPLERIVERLEERKEGYIEQYGKTRTPESKSSYDAYDDAIDIVNEESGICAWLTEL